jgi:hypothetical protein
LKGSDIETYICYTRTHLFRGGPVDLTLQSLRLHDILSVGEKTADVGELGEDRILHRSIISLATMFFGHQHACTQIINQGYAILGITLKHLNRILLEPYCYTSDDVLLSVATLALLEIFVPTGPKHYLKHMLGLEKLLELRGPTTFVSQNKIEIHKGYRRMLIFASLNARKFSLLAKEEWKVIPWMRFPGLKTEEEILLDFLADCTVVMAEREQLVGNWKLGGEEMIKRGEKLQKMAMDLLDDLCDWRREFDNQYQIFSPCGGTQPTQADETYETPPAFSTRFIFQDHSIALMLMLYNTAIIYLLRILESLDQRSPDSPSHQDSTDSLPSSLEVIEPVQRKSIEDNKAAEYAAALEIYHCIPYHFSQKSHLNAGSLTTAHLAIRTAWITLGENGSAEGRRITGILNSNRDEVHARGLWGDGV